MLDCFVGRDGTINELRIGGDANETSLGNWTGRPAATPVPLKPFLSESMVDVGRPSYADERIMSRRRVTALLVRFLPFPG